MTETREVTRLPLPDRLEPKQTSRNLMQNVRIYFYALYNGTKKFRELLGSIGNKDAITGNRLFDRHEAVGMIKGAARKAEDISTSDAMDGDIYRCMVTLMRGNGLGLKLRRSEYQKLTHQAPAE
jgi:hypothetical protein